MTTIADLKTSADANIASNDKVLASNASLKADIATLQTQLATLQGSSTLSPADQQALADIIATLDAETTKNNAA